METDEAIVYRPRSSKLVGGAILPELDAFLHLLILLRLLDTSSLEQVRWEGQMVTWKGQRRVGKVGMLKER